MLPARSMLVGSVLATAVAGAFAVGVSAQSAPGFAFDVASVKQSTDAAGGRNMIQPGGRWEATNLPLRFLIRFAHGVQDDQLVDVPAWAESTRFTIVATSPIPSPTRDQLNQMMQRLLAERFQLRTRRETREMPVYDLDIADRAKGHTLKPRDPVCATAPTPAPPPRPGEPPPCGSTSLGLGNIFGRSTGMAGLAFALSNFSGRHVIDKTGLTDTYSIDLKWTPDVAPGEPAPPGDVPSLFTAVREQLGLKLVSSRAPLEVVVVESVAMPSPD